MTARRLKPQPVPKSAAVRDTPVREGRLSAQDWIEAGQELLRTQGISAIKLATLTGRLAVSTGSFYHHFDDFESYLGALAEHYRIDWVMRDLDNAARGTDPDPVARLQRLARESLRAGTFELDHAMRVWATMDARARASLRRAETLVLEFITQAFLDLGFEYAEASLRARVLLSANVSPLLAQDAKSRGDFFRGCLRLLVADAPRPGASGRSAGGRR